jgi:23S rRNA pseudouridine1911/1915/1917 synthase
MNEHVVLPEQNSTRIDKLLAGLNPAYSRTQVRGWIDQQLVKVNEEMVKANYKCQSGDRIVWTIPEMKQSAIVPEKIPLAIIYEDDALIVVNKPRGMVVHPSPGHASGTLVNALYHYTDQLSGLNGRERAGIVHRLDKDTSGLLVIAKKEEVHEALAEQLAAHKMERHYEAIVHGVIEHEQGLIDAPIGRDPKNRQNMAVVDQGKQAVTHFHVLHRYPAYTYVACELETGRTHQIRVHMKYIGHPIAGDPKYGRRKTLDIDGQALHAGKISFTHPVTDEWLTFTADAPDVFQELLIQLKNNS